MASLITEAKPVTQQKLMTSYNEVVAPAVVSASEPSFTSELLGVLLVAALVYAVWRRMEA